VIVRTSLRTRRLGWAPSNSFGSSRFPAAEVVVLISCWSVKGGAGVTVVAAALALVLAERGPGSLLVDLAGDTPAALGLSPEPSGPGTADWLRAGVGVPADGLSRLEVPVGPGLHLLPLGSVAPGARRELVAGPANQGLFRATPAGPESPAGVGLGPTRGEVLCSLLAADPRFVVADVGLVDGRGTPEGDAAVALAAMATHSLLVLRPCFLALRRAVAAPLRPSGVVLVEEEGRAIQRSDVEATLGVQVCARVPVSPLVARAVDSGLLVRRLPASLTSALRHVA
jgi:Cellulose biosynthesis protein BcsQ